MAQTLLIGLGGTGSRVVNNVAKEYRLKNGRINDGEMCCAVLDTNVNDNRSILDSKTGVPVFPTSKAQKIRTYFDDYHHLKMDSWCPQSPAFLEESMLDGASELRLKSRIAFMDCIESDVIDQFKIMINNVLRNSSDSNIRVMIVSSLSGGTGSGMFIQVALWLRKFLKESQITIRGIFILPDVFISTIKDIRANKATMVRHYCNAYAAIRELNTITKIKKNNSVQLSEKIAIGDLFDSEIDADTGKPVYDYAFFIDDRDENGVRLDSISEYEKMVAQLIFMQLYAPMKDDMLSEEDNDFLEFEKKDEPLYGSCGTAKAVYPTDSVKNYCAFRAVQDSLAGGWRKIDSEMEALLIERKNAERDGVILSDSFDIRSLFVKLFDEKTSVRPGETGRDSFFFSISKDVKNETKVKVDGDKVDIRYTDKVEDFLRLLRGQKIDEVVTRCSGTEDYAINADSFVADDHSEEELINRVKSDESGLEEVLDTFDSKVEEYADGIVNSVFPYSMGDVNPAVRSSIYGLLTKQNEMGVWEFIHPVAARYILYKLAKSMEDALRGIVLADSRADALSGGDISAHFDNKATKTTESGPIEFLKSRKWYQREDLFLDDFEKRYAEFITSKIALCEKYEKECLQVSVYRKLIERVAGLIRQMEAFFNNLSDVQRKLEEELARNITETNDITGKTIFVFAGEKAKESIYRSLDFDFGSGNAKINKSVIDAVYGCLCAEKRPSNPENQTYAKTGVVALFIKEITAAYREKIEGDANNAEKVDMDIYTALCKESDAESGGDVESNTDINDIDFTTGAVRVNNAAAQRHRNAFINCKDRLYRMAAPFLIYDKEPSNNEMGTVTTRHKTFWGFNSAVLEVCPSVGVDLGINADLQTDAAYSKNELYCYRAVYGLTATYIPKFNELKGGNYFTCYKAVVDDMVRDANGRCGARAYVRTPHLDMNWHKILPYVTAEKQKDDVLGFFHGFWLAIAYGMIKVDKFGDFYIKRSIDGGYGVYINDDVALEYNGKKITKTEIARLIEVLMADKIFTDSDIPKLEQRFAEEMDDMATYVGTEILKGLMTKNEDLNPINVITRYNESLNHDKFISAALIGALETIAGELASKYNVERSEKRLEEAKFRICRKIYDSSKRIKGRSEIFARWEDAFTKFKIKEDDASN